MGEFLMAEDEGFKPPIPERGYTGFRVQRIRSLCQSSRLYSLIQCKGSAFLWFDKILLCFLT